MASTQIITIGNVNLDIILGPQAPWPQPGTEVLLENSELREGGAAGNTALALRALGCNQRLLSTMGDDFFGQWLRQRFGELSDDWTPSPRVTSFSVGITHPDGERTFFSNHGHVEDLSAADILPILTPQAVQGATVLLNGSFLTPRLTESYPQLFEQLRANGARIALDTGWPTGGWTPAVKELVHEWIARTDLLLLNEVELCGLTACGTDALAAGLAVLRDRLPAHGQAIVKLGPRGATTLDDGQHEIHVTAPAVTVVDTIGAGDCFNAGFLWAQTGGHNLRKSMEIGVNVASQAISTSPRNYASIAAAAQI